MSADPGVETVAAARAEANDGLPKECGVCGYKWFGAVDKCPNHRPPMTDEEQAEQRRQVAEWNAKYTERAVSLWDETATRARALITEIDASNDDDGTITGRWSEVMHRFEDALRMRSAGAQNLYRDFAAHQDLRAAFIRWRERGDERRQQAEAAKLERKALARSQWRRVTVDGVDITDHIAAMFDAIAASTDWGSGFLSTEDIESIILVAHLVGFDVPEPDPTSAPPELLEGKSQADVLDVFERRGIRERWLAQIAAKARAMRGEVA